VLFSEQSSEDGDKQAVRNR